MFWCVQYVETQKEKVISAQQSTVYIGNKTVCTLVLNLDTMRFMWFGISCLLMHEGIDLQPVARLTPSNVNL